MIPCPQIIPAIVDGMWPFTMASKKNIYFHKVKKLKNRAEKLSIVTCFEQICSEYWLYEAWRWAYVESSCLDFGDWH